MTERIAVLVLLLLPTAALLHAQTAFETRTEHYHIISYAGAEHAEAVGTKLEAMLQLYNRYFRFDLSELPRPLRVRIFSDRSGFERYLSDTIGERRDGFVYLHFDDPDRNELLAYAGDSPEFDYELTHQNFIQYLRTFISHPPLWLREGFAVYFEQAEYDEASGQVRYRENLSWLDPLKEILEGQAEVQPLELSQMLQMDVATARANLDAFYPQAWGMVSLLVQSNRRDINRLLWDSISTLRPGADLRENTDRIYERVFGWIDPDELVSEFLGYIDSRRSFATLVSDGIAAYEDGEPAQAERDLLQALELRGMHHVPYYYLGLIEYDRGNHQPAETYYHRALELGAAEPLTYFALGVNAYAASRYAEAREYLERSAELDPGRFGDRADQLLQRMRD